MKENAINKKPANAPVRLLHGSREDFRAVARIHREGITAGFLSTLGVAFLACLYKGIARDKQSVCFVMRGDSGTIDGFVAGTIATGGVFKRVLLRRWPGLLLGALPVLVRPRTMLHCVETLCYGLGSKTKFTEGKQAQGVSAELLAIAVSSACARRGVGRALVQQLDTWMQSNGAQSYKVVTYAKDGVSNQFYATCGFTLSGQFVHHGNPMNEYVKVLDIIE